MKEHPQDFYLRIEFTLHAFSRMAEHCPHRAADDPDCHHPDMDFNCMVCAPCNCLLLLDDPAPGHDLACFAEEDPLL
jgi:hypothetical protein